MISSVVTGVSVPFALLQNEFPLRRFELAATVASTAAAAEAFASSRLCVQKQSSSGSLAIAGPFPSFPPRPAGFSPCLHRHRPLPPTGDASLLRPPTGQPPTPVVTETSTVSSNSSGVVFRPWNRTLHTRFVPVVFRLLRCCSSQ